MLEKLNFSLPDGSWAGSQLVQERLALLAKLLFLTFCGLALLILALSHFTPDVGIGKWFITATCGLSTVALTGAIWALARRRTRRYSPTSLYILDAVLVVGLGILLAVMAVAQAERPPYVCSVFLWQCYVMFARVLIVPSEQRRTQYITTAGMIPLVLSTIAIAVYWPQFLHVSRYAWIIGGIAWSVAMVCLATLGSRILYGLQERVVAARQFGQYRLTRKIGAGAMGEVWQANHIMMRRPTAIKLLPPDKTTETRRQRFEREVEATSKLTHPNTVEIYDFGRSHDGVFYYVMEYLDGIDLDQLVRRDGPQPPARVIHILEQVCAALREAHEQNFIHRDIKPANIILCERGGIPDYVKVVDFGLVKALDPSVTQTMGEQILGTPAFMGPLVARGLPASSLSDIYAVGALGYYLLTGKLLFDCHDPFEFLQHQVRTDPVPPSRRGDVDVPAALEALIMQCLAKRPTARPASAHALRMAFAELRRDHQWTEADARAYMRRSDRQRRSELRLRDPHEATQGPDETVSERVLTVNVADTLLSTRETLADVTLTASPIRTNIGHTPGTAPIAASAANPAQPCSMPAR